MIKTTKFDAADYLKTPEQIAAYLTEALETGDSAFICTALDTIQKVVNSFGVKLVAQPIKKSARSAS